MTTNAINKAMKSLEERVDRASIDALTEIAEKGKEFAEDLYKTAQYDGEHDAQLYITKEGERTVDLTAVGDSVLFIEYGTGVWGSGKQKWYFSAKGRDIKLTAGGEHATYSRGGYLKTKYFYKGSKGGRNRISEFGYDYSRNVYGDIEWDGDNPKSITFDRSRNSEVGTTKSYDIEKETEFVPQETVERTDSFVTNGNPPQMIMQRTREYMTSIAPEIISKHLKK